MTHRYVHTGVTIFFLRHGETTASRTGGYCGSLDPELTPDGRRMAEDFAVAYAQLQWTAIYSSPLRRAVATVEPLCNATGVRMQLRDELKEITFGQWEGKHPDEVSRMFHDDYIRWLADPGWNAPTGGQNGVNVAHDSMLVIKNISESYTEGNVLIVSHNATIRIMLCSLLGIDVGRFRDRFSTPSGSVSIIEMAVHGPRLCGLGDLTYFREQLFRRNDT